MLRILIADDEYLAIEAVKKIIKNNIEDVNIVATASSGKEAIIKVNELSPDIAIMDIQMPGIDGLEAIRQIKASNPNILFIVLTAYDLFDYAKESIGLGAVEYLLKPIKKDQLLMAIEKASKIVKSKQIQNKWEYELKEKLTLVSPLLENQFITQHMYAFEEFFSKDFYENLFEINLEKGCAITLKITEDGPDDYKTSSQIQAFFETARILLKKIAPCIVSQSVASKQYAWVPNTDDRRTSDFLIDEIKSLHQKLSRQFPYEFKIGIGSLKDYENIYESLKESELAAFGDYKVNVYEADNSVNESEVKDYAYQLVRLAENIGRLDFVGAKHSLKKFHDKISHLPAHIYKQRLLEALVICEKHLPIDMTQKTGEKIERLLNSDSILEMANQFSNFILQWDSEAKAQLLSIEEGVIPDALKYIDKHYNENISMDFVAKQVNISYHYFSKIFKQKIGKSFTDYLTDLRIEKSLEMLNRTQKSVKDISLEIGYNDPNYYCKIFKKITGLTPTEYRAGSDK